jgi:hypothetical protein
MIRKVVFRFSDKIMLTNKLEHSLQRAFPKTTQNPD